MEIRINFIKDREPYDSKIKIFGTEISYSVLAKEISTNGSTTFVHNLNDKVVKSNKNLVNEMLKL